MSSIIKKDLVSVIIPTYNASLYLCRSVQSALSQTYPYMEIIIVDDGSTDDTKGVIKQFENQVTYIYKENGGPASARNIGIQLSTGEYIAFLDADDYCMPDKLTEQINFLKQNPKYHMVHSNALINEPDKELYPAFIDLKPLTGDIFKALFKDNQINNLTVVVKRECIEAINGLDERRELIGIEDYDLWLRIALKYKIGYLDNIVGVYHIHGNNIFNEYKAVKSQLFLIHKFINNFPWIEKEFPGLIEEKIDRVLFRYACLLMKGKNFIQAKYLFQMTMKRPYLRKASIAGIITSVLKTDLFFKDRTKSLKNKHYGNYLNKSGRKKEALRYLLKAVRLFPIQKSVYKYMAKLFWVENGL
jgi:glycosyltransferase involved in cell wall biosynthesis